MEDGNNNVSGSITGSIDGGSGNMDYNIKDMTGSVDLDSISNKFTDSTTEPVSGSGDLGNIKNDLINDGSVTPGSNIENNETTNEELIDIAKGNHDSTSMEFDTMAFNENKLPEMQAAVDDYIAKVEAQIRVISDHQVGAHDGIYGAQAQTVDNYILAICDEMSKIVSFFGRFRDALAEVKDAYVAQSEGID